MSKVISFRLNPDNQREAKVLAILQDWLAQGFSTRHTLTEAILNLDSVNSQAEDIVTVRDLSQQIRELLEIIGTGSFLDVAKDGILSNEKLNDGFVTSIIKSARTGVRHKE